MQNYLYNITTHERRVYLLLGVLISSTFIKFRAAKWH